MMTVRSLLFMLFALIATGCEDETSSEASQLNHKAGELHRSGHDESAYSECEQVSYHSDTDLGKFQKAAQSYVKDLADAIMLRVNTSLAQQGIDPLFSGRYQPESFCFSIGSKIDGQANASANPDNLGLTLTPGIFRDLSDESAIAAVMCHELAHITMNHFQYGRLHPDAWSDFNQEFDGGYDRQYDQCRQFEVELPDQAVLEDLFGLNSQAISEATEIRQRESEFHRARGFDIMLGLVKKDVAATTFLCAQKNRILNFFQRYSQQPTLTSASRKAQLTWSFIQFDLEGVTEETESTLAKFGEFERKLQKIHSESPYAYTNWLEQEADEVGYEICLRAGVDMKKWNELDRIYLANQEGDDSLAACQQSMIQQNEPSRGLGPHPSSCWRIYNIEVYEKVSHLSYYRNIEDLVVKKPLIRDQKRLQLLKDLLPNQSSSP